MNPREVLQKRLSDLKKNADKHHYEKLRHNLIIEQNGLTAAQDQDGTIFYEKAVNPMMFDKQGAELIVALKPKVGEDITPKIYPALDWFKKEIQKLESMITTMQ